MTKETITYTDFLGNERTDTLRFDLNEDEMRDLSDEDKFFNPAFLGRISADRDLAAMYKVIRKLILYSYGELSDDGRYFRKTPEIMNDFAHSAAYKALLEKFTADENGKSLQNFMIGVFPSSIGDQIRSSFTEEGKVVPMK